MADAAALRKQLLREGSKVRACWPVELCCFSCSLYELVLVHNNIKYQATAALLLLKLERLVKKIASKQASKQAAAPKEYTNRECVLLRASLISRVPVLVCFIHVDLDVYMYCNHSFCQLVSYRYHR